MKMVEILEMYLYELRKDISEKTKDLFGEEVNYDISINIDSENGSVTSEITLKESKEDMTFPYLTLDLVSKKYTYDLFELYEIDIEGQQDRIRRLIELFEEEGFTESE